MKECCACYFRKWFGLFLEESKGFIKACCKSLKCILDSINCNIQSICNSLSNTNDTNYLIYASIASVNPIVVTGNYPTNVDDNTVLQYSTNKFALMDLLNPYIVLLLKGKPWEQIPDLPVKFMDLNNFAHNVTKGDIDTPFLSQNVVNNYPYKALYVGNYIVIDPTNETIEKFKNGELN